MVILWVKCCFDLFFSFCKLLLIPHDFWTKSDHCIYHHRQGKEICPCSQSLGCYVINITFLWVTVESEEKKACLGGVKNKGSER